MIPTIDCENNVLEHTHDIFQALSTIGIVNLINFEFDIQLCDDVRNSFRQFWALPMNEKEKYARSNEKYTTTGGNSGYVASDVELLDESSVSELRECYNVTPRECQPPVQWPANLNCEQSTMTLFRSCTKLAEQIMLAISVEYEKKYNVNARPLLDSCQSIFQQDGKNNSSSMRILHYSPVPDNVIEDAKSMKIMRCGEHADYGPLTLLFQDDCGGLEVEDRNGEWLAATPVNKSVLVNMGSIMPRLTSNNLKAVNHRVRILGKESDKKDRYSIAFFLSADDHYVIRPMDGSQSYDPITQHEFMSAKFFQTY